MFRIDTPTATTALPTPAAPGTPGYFTSGNPAAGTPATQVSADWLNMWQEEMMSILAAAGVAPSKTTYNQVLTSLLALMSSHSYAVDTGAANAYAATFSPAVTALSDGMTLRFKGAHANTGPSTFAPNGLPAQPIYGADHNALTGGEIAVNGDVMLLLNMSLNGGAGAWVLLSSGGGEMPIVGASKATHAVNAGQIQTGALIYASDTGAANAYAASFVPAVTALTDGMVRRIKALHANTGPSTFALDGLAAMPIIGADHGALGGGEIIVGGELELQWSASLASWILLASTGGYQRSVTPSFPDNSAKVATTQYINNFTQRQWLKLTGSGPWTVQIAGGNNPAGGLYNYLNATYIISTNGNNIGSYMTLNVKSVEFGPVSITILDQSNYSGNGQISNPTVTTDPTGVVRQFNVTIGAGATDFRVTAFGDGATSAEVGGTVVPPSGINLNLSQTLGYTNAVSTNVVDLSRFGTYSLAATGYDFLPNGELRCWGTASGTSGSVSFPYPFTSAVYTLHSGVTNSSLVAANTTFTSVSLTGFSFAQSTNTTFYWEAKGR